MVGERNPTTGVSVALLIVAGVLTPMALWTSLWGGYGGSTGIAIAQWVVVILLGAGAGGLSLARAKPTRNAFGPSEPVETPPVRPSAMPVVVGSVFIVIAILEGFVLVVNLPGGHLREALGVILMVLLGLGTLFLWLGLRRR
jgi:hypothetical protein